MNAFFPWCILVGFEKWLNFFLPDSFMYFFFFFLNSVWVAQSVGGGGAGVSWEALPATGLLR